DVSARELLQKAIQEYPGTVCFVSHDIEFVRNTATVIVAMEQGRVRKYFGNYDYYLEKSAAMNPAAAPVKTSAPSGDSARERRRERARQRSGISAEKRSAEKEVARLENLLMEQEARRDELIAELSNPDGADFAAAGKELSDLQKAIEETMKAWEDAAWKLDAIMKINAEIHEEK
ncbi:MAG: hypothetical protein J6R85_05750, partial [Lentisphaeria bacterium]|nr:hypothetical protein [Lentisphaeria bacterium]